MPEDARPESYKMIESINRTKYERDYDPTILSAVNGTDLSEYFSKLKRIRLAFIRKYGHDRTVLDICCGPGEHLFRSRHSIEMGVGVDFSLRMIHAAESKKDVLNAANTEFVVSSARQIPFREETFDLVYSFSSLYYVPQVEEVVLEAARLLKPKSIAILELGNLYSLNTIVCRAYPELSVPCHIRIGDMSNVIRDAGLEVVECRRFQILPLWGNRPKWLKPLLHPIWKKILQRDISRKMLDELICNMPILRCYCFRHIFICKKM